MPASTPNPQLLRRVETVIRVLAPALDLVIAIGERVSRVLARDDPDYVPVRIAHEGESAPWSLRIEEVRR